MKIALFLLNTSRGCLVNDCGLSEALYNEKIADPALDVLSDREPPAFENPLIKASVDSRRKKYIKINNLFNSL